MSTTETADEPPALPPAAAEPASMPEASGATSRPAKKRTVPVDRRKIIARLFRILELQVMDLEEEMDQMHRDQRRSGEKELTVLSKLAGNLDKLITLDPAPPATAKRRTKQM
jgi:hypothetical protein